MNISLRLSIFVVLCAVVTMPAVARAQSALSIDVRSFEHTLLGLLNDDRMAYAVAPLTKSSLLSVAAQKKANDMAASSYFAHYSPTGVAPWHWMTSVGYFYTRAGENLALHITDPHRLDAAWMASPSHRANIIRSAYTETGIGVAEGMYNGRRATFVVQFFAKPATPLMRAPSAVPTVAKTF